MSKTIRMRNVPDGVHPILKTRAAVAGMSLSEYVKRDLERIASPQSLEELERRAVERGASGLGTETVLGALRDMRER